MSDHDEAHAGMHIATLLILHLDVCEQRAVVAAGTRASLLIEAEAGVGAAVAASTFAEAVALIDGILQRDRAEYIAIGAALAEVRAIILKGYGSGASLTASQLRVVNDLVRAIDTTLADVADVDHGRLDWPRPIEGRADPRRGAGAHEAPTGGPAPVVDVRPYATSTTGAEATGGPLDEADPYRPRPPQGPPPCGGPDCLTSATGRVLHEGNCDGLDGLDERRATS